MTTTKKWTPEELYMRDANFRILADAWPRLSEWKRWEIFLLAVWFVFRSDLARLLGNIAKAARAAVDTLKTRR